MKSKKIKFAVNKCIIKRADAFINAILLTIKKLKNICLIKEIYPKVVKIIIFPPSVTFKKMSLVG
jgi:hypothetical protein